MEPGSRLAATHSILAGLASICACVILRFIKHPCAWLAWLYKIIQTWSNMAGWLRPNLVRSSLCRMCVYHSTSIQIHACMLVYRSAVGPPICLSVSHIFDACIVRLHASQFVALMFLWMCYLSQAMYPWYDMHTLNEHTNLSSAYNQWNVK